MSGVLGLLACLFGRHRFWGWYSRGYGIAICERCHNPTPGGSLRSTAPPAKAPSAGCIRAGGPHDPPPAWGAGERKEMKGNEMNWFNASCPSMKLGSLHIRLWNVFNRRAAAGHWWGVGLLQIGKRHLFYVGDSGVYPLFLRRTP